MERKPYYEDVITKTEEFSLRTTRELESSKEVNRDSKRSHKKQFDKKRKNPQRLKVSNNMWLEAKNIQLN